MEISSWNKNHKIVICLNSTVTVKLKQRIMFSSDFEINLGNVSIPDSRRFYDIIQKIGEPKKVTKGKQIIRAGSKATYFFYIEAGIFQSSAIVNNKKYILGFTFPGDVDCCPTSLLQMKENNYSIETLSDGEILICDLNKFKKEFSEVEYNKIVNGLLVYYLSIIEKRLIDAISLTAEKRYQQLLQMQPEKVKKIPLKLIAAYLGISIERLSRIRKKMKL